MNYLQHKQNLPEDAATPFCMLIWYRAFLIIGSNSATIDLYKGPSANEAPARRSYAALQLKDDDDVSSIMIWVK